MIAWAKASVTSGRGPPVVTAYRCNTIIIIVINVLQSS
jgi:hypothetical protein